MKPVIAYDLVRISLAGVLLLASALMGYQLATELVVGTGLLDSRWFLIAVVEFELFFGLWLLANIRPEWTRRAAIACFAVFGAVSLYKALLGHATCGCLGRVPVNPWHTCILDLGIVIALFRWRPKEQGLPLSGWWRKVPVQLVVVLVIWLSIGVPVAFVMWTPQSAIRLESDATLVAGNKLVILEPEKWLGNRFPLLDHVDIGERLASDEWLVILHRLNCPDCARVIDWHEQNTQSASANAEVRRVALIKVPQSGEKHEKAINDDHHFAIGTLDGTKEWVFSTPLVLSLDRGIVAQIHNIQIDKKENLDAAVTRSSEKRRGPEHEDGAYNRTHSETACGPLSLLAALESMRVKVTGKKRARFFSPVALSARPCCNFKNWRKRCCWVQGCPDWPLARRVPEP